MRRPPSPPPHLMAYARPPVDARAEAVERERSAGFQAGRPTWIAERPYPMGRLRVRGCSTRDDRQAAAPVPSDTAGLIRRSPDR